MTSFQFEMQDLRLYKPVLNHFLNSPDGETGKYLRARAQVILTASRRQVGVDTGALRRSIHMIHHRNTRGQYYWIGSDNKIALMHHEGTRPHMIVPRQAQLLRFSVGTRIVNTRLVRHPGTKPNRYLSDQLRLVRF